MIDLIGLINPLSPGHIGLLPAIKFYTKWVDAVALNWASRALVTSFTHYMSFTILTFPYVSSPFSGTPFIKSYLRELCKEYGVDQLDPSHTILKGAKLRSPTRLCYESLAGRFTRSRRGGQIFSFSYHRPIVPWSTLQLKHTFFCSRGLETVAPIEMMAPLARLALTSMLFNLHDSICDIQALEESRHKAENKSLSYQKQSVLPITSGYDLEPLLHGD